MITLPAPARLDIAQLVTHKRWQRRPDFRDPDPDGTEAASVGPTFTCSRCRKRLPLEVASTPAKTRGYCRPCKQTYDRDYARKNRKRILARRRARRERKQAEDARA